MLLLYCYQVQAISLISSESVSTCRLPVLLTEFENDASGSYDRCSGGRLTITSDLSAKSLQRTILESYLAVQYGNCICGDFFQLSPTMLYVICTKANGGAIPGRKLPF
jgi:hypothetical protein